MIRFRVQQDTKGAFSRRSRTADIPRSGFTLIELVSVLVLVSILAVAAIISYQSLLDDSKRNGAANIIAAAQTQLSLEFARRAVSGLALDVASQPICDWVIIDSPRAAASVTCSGNLDENVSITATIETISVGGNWNSPIAGGS